jgi:radical SAM protein with 4Fe4S-binding SPASM domain
LVTNGFRFSRRSFLNKIIDSGIDSISLSLKAGNRKQFKLLTATDSFFEIAKSIENLSRSGIDANFSITISSLVVHNLKQMVEFIADNGGEHISLEFCTPVFENSNFKKGYALSPRIYADKIVEIYSEIEKIEGIDIWIEQSLPRCVWPIEFIKKLELRNQIGFGCHVQNRDGIIFDTEGDVIPCNCLNNIKFGNFPKDFNSPDNFHDFWNQRDVLRFYDKFMSYPSVECIECSDYQICGGGCPLNWFSFVPEDINLKKIA